MGKTIIIGGGAAGMMTAALLFDAGEVILFEKNERLGKKLYITGKGRCNLTNACDRESFISSIVSNGRFLYGAFNRFNNFDCMDFFEQAGVKLKTERGQRVFPESDRAQDIIDALEKTAVKNGCKIRKNIGVSEILLSEEDGIRKVCGVKLSDGTTCQADSVVVATGGLSYPSTGSTGDGYRFARESGHEVTKCYPSLVAFKTEESECAEMAGLSLKNIRLNIEKDGREIWSGFGEMLFTHSGVSGPLILTASAEAGIKCEGAVLHIDLKAALDEKTLDDRLLREFEASKNRQIKSVIRSLLPASMTEVFIKRLSFSGETEVNSVSREMRREIVGKMKDFDFRIKSLAGYNEAVVTKGGVSVKNINPKTMESKLVKGLFFVGEVIDVDALTGGFNLQIAWSSAAAAAAAINERNGE